MIRIPIVFFLIVLVGTASASVWLGPFEIQNEEFFDCDWSIADEHGKPTKDIKYTDNSWAWIDIVGFENMSIINNVRYVNGTPRSFAIVKRDSGYSVPEDCVFVSYDVTLKIIDTEWDYKNDTTTILYTKFVYKEWVCETGAYGIVDCWWVFYKEEITTSCTVDSPETFDNSISDYVITITSYNNSVSPYTLIYVPDRDNIIKATVEYKNNRSVFYNRTGWVTTNPKGTEYVKFINETWDIKDKTHTVTRISGYEIIDEAPLNFSLLNISVYTPYIEKNDCVWNVTVVDSKPSDFISWKMILVFTSTIGVFFIGLFTSMKRR